MDAHELLAGTRWELIQVLAKKPSTGSQLAHALKTTPANVSQHLKLLELGGLVTKERVRGERSRYQLTRPVALVTLLDSHASRTLIPLDPLRAAALRMIADPKPSARYVRAFLAEYEELASTFIAFGKLPESHEVQLLVIADDVQTIRKEYSNIHIGAKKIVLWSHTPAEFEEGLRRKEDYFTNMLRTVEPLADYKGLCARWREEYL